MEVEIKIDILDGYKENPGDLSWKGFEEIGESRLLCLKVE